MPRDDVQEAAHAAVVSSMFIRQGPLLSLAFLDSVSEQCCPEVFAYAKGDHQRKPLLAPASKITPYGTSIEAVSRSLSRSMPDLVSLAHQLQNFLRA